MRKNICVFLLLTFSVFIFSEQETNNANKNNFGLEEIELIKNRTGENKAGFYFKDIEKNKAVLFLDGFWDASFFGIASFEFFKSYSKINSIQPIFKQKAHLSLWLLLNKQFYFETLYKDDYKKSVIALGYFGKTDSAVKHIRAGNSGIKFPIKYGFINSGGGNVIAPGIMGTFAGDSWKTDTMLRYESSVYNSKVYYGKNEINKTGIAINSWSKAQYFYIPCSNLYGRQLQVFVKDYSDSGWKKLTTDEFAVNTRENTVTLKKSFPYGVAVSYLYSSAEESEANNFLANLKSYFSNAPGIQSQIKTSVALYKGKIIGQEVLILKEENTFSPFEIASRYAGQQTNVFNTISVIELPSENKSAQFNAEINSSEFFFDNLKKITFIQVINKTASVGFNNPEQMFPFAEHDYKIYIPNNTDEENVSAVISFETYIPNSEFSIPDTAIPGSVRIYKNKTETFDFIYDDKTNAIIFTQDILSNDIIEIEWREGKTYSDSGTVKFAGGIHWLPVKELDVFFASSGDWEITKQKKQLTDVYGLSTGIEFSKYNIKTGTVFGFSVEADRDKKAKEQNYIFKNKTYFDYTVQEILLEKNNEPIFSNPHFYIDGNFKTESDKQTPAINSGMEANIDIWKIKLNGNLSLKNNDADKTKIIESYGHSIYIPIYFFSASENYFVNRHKNTVRRNNALCFEKYVFINYTTAIDYNKEFTNQKISVSISPLIPAQKFGILYNEIRFDINQKYKTPYDNSNLGYSASWKKTLLDMYSKGKKDAENRNSELNIIFNIFSERKDNSEKNVFFSGFNFEATAFTRIKNTATKQCDEQTQLSVSIPFEVKNVFFTPVFERKILKNKPEIEIKNQNKYADDLYSLFKGMGEQFWLFSKPIIYDLFDKKINKQIQKNNFNNYVFYNLYGLNISRLITATTKDLYMPIEFNTAFSRIVKSETSFLYGSNMYTLDFSVKYTALNISGKFGYFNWFSWYEQDELNRIYKWNFSFGKDYFKFKFNSIHSLYYFFGTNNLGFENEFNCTAAKPGETKLTLEEWKEKTDFILTLTGSSSLPHLIIHMFSTIPLIDSREERLSVELSNSPERKKINYAVSFMHSQITKIGEHGEIKIFAEFSGTSTKKDSFLLNISAGISGKVEY